MLTMDTSLTRSTRIAALLFLSAGILWILIELIVASAFRPSYSYANNFISDLGVPIPGAFDGRPIDSPLAWLANLGFIAQGVLFLLGSIAILRGTNSGIARWIFLSLAGIYAIGFVLIATFHGSSQAQEAGLIRFHFLGGSLAALAGNFALIFAGIAGKHIGVSRSQRLVSIGLGVVGLFCAIMLSIDQGHTPINLLPPGIWERGIAYSTILWEILLGTTLLLAERDHRLTEAE